MKPRFLSLPVLFLLAWLVPGEEWKSLKQKNYTLYYTAADAGATADYKLLLKKGVTQAEDFFGHRFKSSFSVYVHPGRASLDSTWRNDWKMPGFKSECWMVASGVASRLDLLSPQQWALAACEHQYSDRVKTQQVITHELVHVYHGQHNPSPDFSNTEGIDWLVEGLATYASGQCDANRLAEIRKLIMDKKEPATLDQFWTGKLRYGLAGTMVMYIDQTFGRDILRSLMPLTRKQAVLETLKVTEQELLRAWAVFMTK